MTHSPFLRKRRKHNDENEDFFDTASSCCLSVWIKKEPSPTFAYPSWCRFKSSYHNMVLRTELSSVLPRELRIRPDRFWLPNPRADPHRRYTAKSALSVKQTWAMQSSSHQYCSYTATFFIADEARMIFLVVRANRIDCFVKQPILICIQIIVWLSESDLLYNSSDPL